MEGSPAFVNTYNKLSDLRVTHALDRDQLGCLPISDPNTARMLRSPLGQARPLAHFCCRGELGNPMGAICMEGQGSLLPREELRCSFWEKGEWILGSQSQPMSAYGCSGQP